MLPCLVGSTYRVPAREALILRPDAHLDSLAEKLHEDRVRRVIEPILIGAEPPMGVMNDESYLREVGGTGGERIFVFGM